jgi:hypothetical protein
MFIRLAALSIQCVFFDLVVIRIRLVIDLITIKEPD